MNPRDELWAAIGYSPSKEQLAAHDFDGRYAIVAGGEQAGKSFSAGKQALWRIVQYQAYNTPGTKFEGRPGLWWIVGATYDLCRPEFGYLLDDLSALGMIRNIKRDVRFPKEGQCSIELDFGKIETRSAEDASKIAMYAPNGFVVCEAAQLDYYAWLKIIGRAGPRRAWIWASGCISGDSLVHTSSGIREIQSLGSVSMSCPEIVVRGINHLATADKFYVDGVTETVRIRTQKRFEIEGTPNHKILAIRPSGNIEWAELSQLSINDYVAIRRGAGLWGNGEVNSPYLIGLYVSEGCCSEDRITISTIEPETEQLLGSHGFMKQRNSCHWRKTDHGLCDYWRSIGLNTTLTARDKEIPSGILSSREPVVSEFLRGLFDGNGCAHKHGKVTYATASKKLARQLQVLLLSYGIVASINPKTDKLNGKEFESYIVDIGTDSQKFYDKIGFGLPRKQALQSACRAKAVDRIPYQRKRIRAVYKSVPQKHGRDYEKWRHLAYGTAIGTDKSQIMALLEERPDEQLGWLVNQDIYWARVLDKESGFAKCYDLVVPGEHSYTANGFIVHNTFEGSYGWYPEWWKLWQGNNALGGRSFSVPSWSNLMLYPGGREDPEIKRLESVTPPDMFQERYGAIPCPPSTLVFREFSVSKHVVRQRFDDEFKEIYEDENLIEIKLPRDHEVEVWIDPGYAGAYAVSAVMRIGEKVYNFDEVYEQHKTAREIIAICKGKWWWPKVVYGVMDIAGRQHQGMESHEEIWMAEAKIPIYSQVVGVADGIERHRTFLARGPNAEPYIYHDPDRCSHTIQEYYKYKYPDVKEDRPIKEVPIDANNHALKAIAYGLVWDYGFVRYDRRERIWESPFDDWTDRITPDRSYLPIELR